MSPFRPSPLFSSPDPAASEAPDAVSPTLADVFRRYGDASRATHSVTAQQRRVMDAIRHCRTFEMGYHVDVCTHCGHTEIRPNSCGNRHCPHCQECNPPSAHDEIIMRPYSKRRNDHWLPFVGINEAFLAGYETQ